MIPHDPPILFDLSAASSERLNFNGHFPAPMESIPELVGRHDIQVEPGPDLMQAVDESARIQEGIKPASSQHRKSSSATAEAAESDHGE